MVPASGWAALVATLGGVQFDNFTLEGRASGGVSTQAIRLVYFPPGSTHLDFPGCLTDWLWWQGAVAACGSSAPAAGDKVVATPCDAPGALHSWEKLPGGQLQLSSTTLCIGSGGVLAPCAGQAADLLSHERSTGRITTATDTCLDVLGWPGHGGVQWPQAITNATCGPIPENSQQYQYHPGTTTLRPKASMCIAGFAASELAYRDCCLSVCPRAA